MFRTLLEIGVKTSTFAHFCKEMEHGPGRIYLAIGQSRHPIRFRAQGTPRPHTLTLSSSTVRPIPSFWAGWEQISPIPEDQTEGQSGR